MFEHYLTIAQPWLDQYGYFALFISVFLEGFGMPTPGESLIVASSLLAGRGDMHIVPILLAAWSAAVLGDNTGYLLGRWGGLRLLHKLRVKPDHLLKVEGFFQRYGGGIVVVARFFPILRQLNGVVAGSMKMSWWRFLMFNLLGAALWVGFWGGGVYFLGGHFEQVEQIFHGLVPFVVVAGLAALLGLVWYLKPWIKG
ncbi:DedA family protein [Thiolinea disciformis]|uniref:DedA family protein n=1 Tax=Thiolinea disciformis TaxID=125614 RepID=UPI00037AC3E5|nr:DedA family protein [Thiolinea disciformis]